MDCADADLGQRFIGGEQYWSAGHIAESAYCCDHSTVPATHRWELGSAPAWFCERHPC